jgi:hypothetical protein
MNQEKAIRIPEWYRQENPKLAGMCDIINEALEMNPNMSLADFAKVLDANHVEQSYQRIQEAVRKQFEGEAV